jgi:hypothetical protein
MSGEESGRVPSRYLEGSTGPIKWRKLMEELFVSGAFAISAVWSGVVQVPFKLASGAYATLYGGFGSFLEQVVDAEAWGVGTAWEAASTSLGDWGILSYVFAVVLIAGWLAFIGFLVQTAVEVMTDV